MCIGKMKVMNRVDNFPPLLKISKENLFLLIDKKKRLRRMNDTYEKD